MPGFDLNAGAKKSQNYDNLIFSGSSEHLLDDNTLHRKRTRYIILAVVAVCVLALVIGLAVGLTRKSPEAHAGDQSAQGAESTIPATSTKPPSSTVSKSTAKVTSEETSVTSFPGTNATSPTLQTTAASTLRPGNWMSTTCSDPAEATKCKWRRNPLLLVSLDGFRAEYLLRNLTPTIEKLRDCGVHTPYMRSVYPTLTFPNHYTIVTGMYPVSHGIVGNSMYDPELNSSFSISGSAKFDPAWWAGEPLWVTAKKAGRRTASYFWVGSEVNISGIQPDIWMPYSGSVPYEDRIDTVLAWLDMADNERPEFITLYFDEPDHEGHGSGPDSEKVNAMLERMDTIIRRLMDGLHAREIHNCVNVIILADHGMAETSCQRQVDLDTYLTGVHDLLIYSGTTGHINNRYHKSSGVVYENKNVMPVEDIMSNIQCRSPHLKVYSAATAPVRHHYTNSPRLGQVLLDVEESWLVYPTKQSSCLQGNHGYDNLYKSMHALFLAHGPDLRSNITVEPFENIELYNLMTVLLDLEPAPNNGTVGALHHFLRDASTLPTTSGARIQTCVTPEKARGTDGCTCDNMSQNISFPSDVGTEVFPLGRPLLQRDVTGCLLNGRQFSSVYSWKFKASTLSSFPLSGEQMRNFTAPSGGCLVPDPRLDAEDNPDCAQFVREDIEYAFLFDPGFSYSSEDILEARLTTNKVPMYIGFKEGVWSFAWRVAGEYVTLYNYVHVSVGPAYDYNFDGLADPDISNLTVYVNSNSTVPLPTHFYMILIKCGIAEISDCKEEEIDILAFILPHQNLTTNCMTRKDFLVNNVARVRDIELLTGLQFLTSFDGSAGARLRTFLPTELWPSPVLTPWVDLPCPAVSNSCSEGRAPLLLISLDGFRADYLDRHLTPTIQRLAQCGVHTPYMRSVYPTVTFPNHYTIVTGLYPESHGIVSNNMYDEEIDKVFSLSAATSKDPRWWEGEPIWITAKKQSLKTATYFWPGSDVNISGIYPDIWKHYDGKVGYTQRVYEVLDWLTMPAGTRPDFITLYFDEPDHAGHNSGPESEEVDGQLETVDELINILLSNLYEKGLHSCVNLIVLADHGMSPQSCDKTVSLKEFNSNITNMLVFDRAFGMVFPQFQQVNRTDAHRLNSSFPMEDIVDSLMCEHPAMKVFTKDTMPRRHHFMNSKRIADIGIDMRDEWNVLRDSTTWCTGGNHGWDNTYKNMHALFLAHGPAFKENFTAEPFENIELYNLMSEVLNISAAPNNGTLGSLRYILRNISTLPEITSPPTLTTCQADVEEVVQSCTCDQQMNLMASDILLTSHEDGLFPWGEPSATRNDTTCLLHQPGYSLAFSHMYNAPVLLTTTFNVSLNYSLSENVCLLNDSRTPSSSVSCSAMINGTRLKLYPLTYFGTEVANNAYLTSTVVPLYEGFYRGIWTYLHEQLNDYKLLYGDLSLSVGTVYDYHNDGIFETVSQKTRYADQEETTPIPTHIYAIVVKCRSSEEKLPCLGGLDVLSFILPNLQEPPNCLRSDLYLKDNVARVRDIELLTGLEFFTKFDAETAARLRTFLPEDVWATNRARSWEELPCPQQDICQSDYRPLLLISLDGFRADYLLRNMTPTISRLSQCGVHAPYMRSVFPTKTFPNHYSIVTGLYPESHGIIDNNMYDMEIGKRFYLGSDTASDPRWWGGEPIWLTAKKHGLRTATYFWPGSDVNIQGQYPDIWRKYDGSVSYYSRVQEVLSWMSLPAGERPDFITLYFDEPDLAGHKYGPSDEKQIASSLARVDETIGELMKGLFTRNLHHCVNIVIIADHGMEDVSCSRIVRLRYYVDYNYLSSNFYVWEGPFGRIANEYIYNGTLKDISPAGNPEPTDELLTNLTCATPHMDVYTKSTLPVRHHYTNNDRIDDVLLDVETSWLVTRSYINVCRGGNHGYDNIYRSMEALFLAYGPSFKWNLTIPAFENIELYNMFADILNITAAPNNGTNGALDHLLNRPKNRSDSPNTLDYQKSEMTYKDEIEFLSIVRACDCCLNCSNVSDSQIKKIFIDIASAGRDTKQVPLGIPLLTTSLSDLLNTTLMYQPDYTLAYSSYLQMPLWMSTTFDGQPKLQVDGPRCILPDPRISPDSCNISTDVVFTPLLDSLTFNTAGPAVHLKSSTVRMKKKFYEDIWKPVLEYIESKGKNYSQINILTGPVFDSNHDSLFETFENLSTTSLPSHFFIILTSCVNNRTLDDCDEHHIESYIIPHNENIRFCKGVEVFVLENEARARDVELITGIYLFQRLPFYNAVRLKTMLPLSFN